MTTPPQQGKQIAVIGAGISGLAAAHRIGELDSTAQVSVFEASGRPGGIIGTIRQDGFLIEQSADSFITNSPWAIELCRTIGLADDLIPTEKSNRGALVVSRGKLKRVPESFVLMSPDRIWPTLRSPILSISGKVRLLCERFIKPRMDAGDESVAQFARRRLGREAFERLVQPLVGGIYTADPERLSMAAALPRFVEMERRFKSLSRAARIHRQTGSDAKSANEFSAIAESGARYSLFMTPRDGLSSLIEKLAARLPKDCLRLRTAVQRIDRSGNRWSITSGALSEEQDKETRQFDAVIVATPAPVAAKLLHHVDDSLSGELAAIEHAGSAIVVLGYDQSQLARPLDSFGFVAPVIERRKILSASFSSMKFPGRAPPEKVLIRVFLGGALQPKMLELDDDQLQRVAKEELHDLLHVSGSPCLSMVFRWPAAMPQYHLGHLDRLARIKSRLSQWSGLTLAGNAYEGVGLPQCINSGQEAAEKVFERHRSL